MGNDSEIATGNQVSNTQLTNQEDLNKVAAYKRELAKGGYYKSVTAPQDYLATKSDGQVSRDTELTDDTPNKKSRLDTKVDPLKFWSTGIKKKFEECTDAQKKAWLESFQIVEKGYLKQAAEMKEAVAASENILNILTKNYDLLSQLQISPNEYIEELIKFDRALGANPTYEIAKLVARHNIPLDNIAANLKLAIDDVVTSNYVTDQVLPLKQELNALKSNLGLNAGGSVEDNAAAIAQADEVASQIQAFFDQRDNKGNLIYPNAFDHIEDIVALGQQGMTLHDAYNTVMSDDQSQSGNERIDYDGDQSSLSNKLSPRDEEKQYLLSVLNRITRS